MKKTIFILALLMFIVSMGCASAAEDANETLSSDDGSEILTSRFDGNFGQLQDLIDEAEEGDIITLTEDYSGSGEITIDKGLTINGAGHEIDANYESSIFYVDAESEVYLYGITFTRGYSGDAGGAIFAETPLYIAECEFYQNIVLNDNNDCYGGAIYSEDKLVIIDSDFTGNYADMGGAIYSYAELIMNNTGFVNNRAAEGGGAIAGYHSNMSVTASGFRNNTAGEYGGSIFAGQILYLRDNIFISEDDTVEIIDYYSKMADSESYLYLENNLIDTPCDYSIWYESVNPIISPVNLVFTEREVKKGDEISVAMICDDMENIIRYDPNVTMKIYDGNSLVKTVNLAYDGGYYYECDLDEGTYRLTGSLESEYVDELTVYDGELTVEGSGEKTIPNVTTTCEVNGNAVTLTAELIPSDATGIVTFYLGENHYDPEVIAGKATQTLRNLEDGTYTVKTLYRGDETYEHAYAEDVDFTISTTGIVLNAPALSKFYGGSERFEVTLTEDGKPLSGKTVKITINGQDYERTTDSSGNASMAINLNSGEYPARVEAEGELATTTVTVMPTISGNDITKIFRNATQYYATFVDAQGNPLKNAEVEFNINGVFYKRTTNENGIARLNINLNPDTYILTAKNPATGEQFTNTVTVLTNIIEHNDLTKYYKNDSQYRIRILADDGSIAKAGVKVTFNINGVYYDRYSDDNGYVQLRINLNPNDYIITANYNGLMASNHIKVLNILFGNDVTMEYKDGSKYTVLLLDGQGNPYPDQTIRLNINGAFYDRVTGSDGIAILNINLGGGTYTITATYNGLSCSNTVTVNLPYVPYDCGNGHQLQLPKTASLEEYDDEENYIHGLSINYGDGIADFEIEYYYSDCDSKYRNEVMSYYLSNGAKTRGYYGAWGVLNMNTLTSQGYPQYSLWLGDGYLYTIWSDNINIAKRVAESFR